MNITLILHINAQTKIELEISSSLYTIIEKTFRDSHSPTMEIYTTSNAKHIINIKSIKMMDYAYSKQETFNIYY